MKGRLYPSSRVFFSGGRVGFWLLRLSVSVEGRSSAYNSRDRNGHGERPGGGGVGRDTGRGNAVSFHPPPPW